MSEQMLSREIANEIALNYIKDTKSKRRWRTFKISIALIVFVIFVLNIFFSSTDSSMAHIALVNVDGVISQNSNANSQRIIRSLENAYKDKNTKAIIVQINSPGGSPVQSDDIFSYMRYMQNKHPNIPMYSLCSDICASGGYYIAAGAKKIYANKMSITGSIGVVGSGFGFNKLLDKIGVERRTYTAGENKDFLDPFSPEKAQQTKEFEKILKQTHSAFIKSIEKSRGSKIKSADKKTIFSGIPFSGIQAKKLGLIDGFSSLDEIRRNDFDNIPVVEYTQKLDLFSTVLNKISSNIYYSAESKNHISMR